MIWVSSRGESRDAERFRDLGIDLDLLTLEPRTNGCEGEDQTPFATAYNAVAENLEDDTCLQVATCEELKALNLKEPSAGVKWDKYHVLSRKKNKLQTRLSRSSWKPALYLLRLRLRT